MSKMKDKAIDALNEKKVVSLGLCNKLGHLWENKERALFFFVRQKCCRCNETRLVKKSKVVNYG